MSRDLLWDESHSLKQLLSKVKATGWQGWPQEPEPEAVSIFAPTANFPQPETKRIRLNDTPPPQPSVSVETPTAPPPSVVAEQSPPPSPVVHRAKRIAPKGRASSISPYSSAARIMTDAPFRHYPPKEIAPIGYTKWFSDDTTTPHWERVYEDVTQRIPFQAPEEGWFQAGLPSFLEDDSLQLLIQDVENMYSTFSQASGPIQPESIETFPLLDAQCEWDSISQKTQHIWEHTHLTQRLHIFLEWLLPCSGGYMAFLVDEEGNPMAELSADELFMSVTGMLPAHVLVPLRTYLFEEAVRRLAVQQIVLEVDAEYVFQVIWIETPLGRLALGLVLPLAIGGHQLQLYQRLLLSILAIP
ncbi:MAG TPA: hypothetical protein DCE42_27915 [Myxococcales bacterium]|nr:hypothetical protein [Myxococcales bacterium]